MSKNRPWKTSLSCWNVPLFKGHSDIRSFSGGCTVISMSHSTHIFFFSDSRPRDRSLSRGNGRWNPATVEYLEICGSLGWETPDPSPSIFPVLNEQWKVRALGGCLGYYIRGWTATQLCGDYFINHETRIPFLNNQEISMEAEKRP